MINGHCVPWDKPPFLSLPVLHLSSSTPSFSWCLLHPLSPSTHQVFSKLRCTVPADLATCQCHDQPTSQRPYPEKHTGFVKAMDNAYDKVAGAIGLSDVKELTDLWWDEENTASTRPAGSSCMTIFILFEGGFGASTPAGQ